MPDFALKRSAVPGFINELWFKVDSGKEGIYRGQCAALCGRDHGFMPVVVKVVLPGDYQAWTADQRAAQKAATGADAAAAGKTFTLAELTGGGERVYAHTCIACHQLEADHFTHTLHALGLHVANRSDPTIPVCEACHGAGSEHAARPLVKGLIIGYTNNAGTPIPTQTATCLACHGGGPRDHWLGSVHQRNGLSCSDCHNPMSKFSVEGLMAKASINDTCLLYTSPSPRDCS